MTSVSDSLAGLRASATHDHHLGARFERLMVAYLQTDPPCSDLYADVSRRTDWPGLAPLTETCLRVVSRCADYAGGSG
jgi:predicted helicase